MDKRYQVFVSSTYHDLQLERQEVMQALLELDCIPSGMELFPAANEDQWTLIKKVIDDCDYYLVIIAGRYGSLAPSGSSYPELEYRYALDRGKPIIGFLHKDPDSLPAKRCESNPEARDKLKSFRAFVEQKMIKYWTTPSDLGSVVSRSLIKLIKQNPAIGWVRGDLVPNESAAEEILRLKKVIEDLETSLASVRTQAPEDAHDLAQGSDQFKLHFGFDSYNRSNMERKKYRSQFSMTWHQIFSVLSPLMMDEATESKILSAINSFIEQTRISEIRERKDMKGLLIQNIAIFNEDFQTIIVQLRALGLITKSIKQRSLRDRSSYWTLTPYGDSVMTKLRAIRSQVHSGQDSTNTDAANVS